MNNIDSVAKPNNLLSCRVSLETIVNDLIVSKDSISNLVARAIKAGEIAMENIANKAGSNNNNTKLSSIALTCCSVGTDEVGFNKKSNAIRLK